MKIALSSKRLIRFWSVRKAERSSWKKMMIATRPASTGNAPLSPFLIRRHQAAR
jgi:hypothetical protein